MKTFPAPVYMHETVQARMHNMTTADTHARADEEGLT